MTSSLAVADRTQHSGEAPDRCERGPEGPGGPPETTGVPALPGEVGILPPEASAVHVPGGIATAAVAPGHGIAAPPPTGAAAPFPPDGEEVGTSGCRRVRFAASVHVGGEERELFLLALTGLVATAGRVRPVADRVRRVAVLFGTRPDGARIRMSKERLLDAVAELEEAANWLADHGRRHTAGALRAIAWSLLDRAVVGAARDGRDGP